MKNKLLLLLGLIITILQFIIGYIDRIVTSFNPFIKLHQLNKIRYYEYQSGVSLMRVTLYSIIAFLIWILI